MKTISVFCCLLYATWTEGARINVEGFKGGDVSFPSSHKLAWKNNKYFCKDPCKDNKDMMVTVGSGRRAQSGRITLVDLGNGVFTVTISQLQLSDSGKYWCGVDRPGLDTFTEVCLTVKEAVANETTVTPEPSTTWTWTQVTSGMDTSRPTNLSTASNFTNGGEQNTNTGTVLYAALGAVATLTILVLLWCFRKRREDSKPQTQACSNSTDIVIADEREIDCEYDEIGEEVQSLKKLSERFSCAHYPKQDPPTSASTEAECNVQLHIYENICCSRRTADSRHSAANVHNGHDNSSAIYINPLPTTLSETTGDGSLGIHTTKPKSTRKNKSRHSRACRDSTEERPRSLWFGLDLSGTV